MFSHEPSDSGSTALNSPSLASNRFVTASSKILVQVSRGILAEIGRKGKRKESRKELLLKRRYHDTDPVHDRTIKAPLIIVDPKQQILDSVAALKVLVGQM